jgi:hypothetical protein
VDELTPYPLGKPLRLDPEAESADPALPAFLARPAGAPVYHGFPLLDESRTEDGWCFGTISDPDCPEGSDWGDAFVVAPDNSRAGLIWHVGPPELKVSLEPEPDRWGVFAIGIASEVHSQAELIEYLQAWLPELRRRHSAWAAERAPYCDPAAPPAAGR